jgi:hypothetical protein
MPSDPSSLPSVACLLYLAADQIAPRGMSGKMLKATKVPCRPVWVQPSRLSATIAAATFVSCGRQGEHDTSPAVRLGCRQRPNSLRTQGPRLEMWAALCRQHAKSAVSGGTRDWPPTPHSTQRHGHNSASVCQGTGS